MKDMGRKMKKKVVWTKADKEYIKNNYLDKSWAEIGEILNKSPKSIKAVAHNNKLVKYNRANMTDAEKALIILACYDYTDEELSQFIGKSTSAINSWRRRNACMKFKELHKSVKYNTEYGFITTIEHVRKTSVEGGAGIWKCQCRCGKEIVLHSKEVIDFVHREFKCHCDEILTQKITSRYMRAYKGSTKDRGLEILIDEQYMFDLFNKQNRKCALSGIDIFLAYNNASFDTSIQTASLDRIDSNKGYIEGNVQWIHKDLNLMKHAFDQNYFISMCKQIAEYNK